MTGAAFKSTNQSQGLSPRTSISEAELATMDHREVSNLMFLPGFSTAEQVTDVSGRGVGMDVVRTNIRQINGSVDLESEPGKGSQIIIKLPLTIAIIQALMVEVQAVHFAIPLVPSSKLSRSRTDIKTINGREVLHLRDRVLPLIRLAQEFSHSDGLERERFMWWSRPGRPTCRRRGRRTALPGGSRHQVYWDYLGTVKGYCRRHDYRRRKVVLILDTSELVQNARLHNSGVEPERI